MARAKTTSKPATRTKTAKKRTKRPVSVAPTTSITTSTPQDAMAGRAWPAGKLGLLLEHVATDAGATAEELIAATGWQRHSVRGALSRLRAQGFATRLETIDDRKAYCLVPAEA